MSPLHSLTSKSKLDIVERLGSPTSPARLAESLGMTRQAVDKHLKELMNYGIVERIWVTGSRKPRLEYKITSLGLSFYQSARSLIVEYRESGRTEYQARLKSLDLQLVSGEIELKKYQENRVSLEDEMRWFLDKGP